MFKIILLIWLASTPCHAEFRDPTQPGYPVPTTAADVVATDKELVLSAILISSKSKRATINGISVKQGETVEIKQAPPVTPEPTVPATTAGAGVNPNDLLNKVAEFTSAEANRLSPGNVLAPLMSAVTGGSNITQLLESGSMNTTANAPEQTKTDQRPKIPHLLTRPMTIKVISIQKNSVIIEQNGERRTLQLVQRPYKTQ